MVFHVVSKSNNDIVDIHNYTNTDCHPADNEITDKSFSVR